MLQEQHDPDGFGKASPGGPAQPAPPAALAQLAALAGVTFNGDKPWDIQVFDAATYERILTSGSLGLGESFVDGQWDAAQVDELINRFLRARVDNRLHRSLRLRLLGHALSGYLKNLLRNRQSRRHAHEVGERHYDIGNPIYQAMLDPTMSYSCAYWETATNLADAQQAKLDLICRKLKLQAGERLLDIGCGWGGLAEFAARHYGVNVTGITVSKEQAALARERLSGLPASIELMDYRSLEGQFDKVVSVGMFEHVGPKNYRTFFRKVRRLMQPGGCFLLHTIGEYRTTTRDDPWIDTYIFPNGKLPSAKRISKAFEGLLTLQDWHNFGPDYDRTLMAWWENFDRAWPQLKSEYYDEHFYRMWKYYLQCCAGFFRSGRGQLWQIVFTGAELQGTYRSVR
ncbi:cyclopropane fatty acyl phospholipid synthase [Haliea sp. E17]|uniref:cyclopropane fatty acyl phospholipid synthase n=1 Tax=Haliea sp. E17 TaxID=3401576 RepID=UPI003AAABE51